MANENDFTCRSDSLVNRIGCVLIYPSTFDIALNYGILILNLAYCAFEVIAVSTRSKNQIRKACALGSLVFVVFFQITLCLIVGCFGISIVWCAMLGWVISEKRRMAKEGNTNEESTIESSETITILLEKLAKFIILLDLGTIVYYVVTAEAITTTAHICAIILGAVLSEISIRLAFATSEGTTGSEQPLLGSSSQTN